MEHFRTRSLNRLLLAVLAAAGLALMLAACASSNPAASGSRAARRAEARLLARLATPSAKFDTLLRRYPELEAYTTRWLWRLDTVYLPARRVRELAPPRPEVITTPCPPAPPAALLTLLDTLGKQVSQARTLNLRAGLASTPSTPALHADTASRRLRIGSQLVRAWLDRAGHLRLVAYPAAGAPAGQGAAGPAANSPFLPAAAGAAPTPPPSTPAHRAAGPGWGWWALLTLTWLAWLTPARRLRRPRRALALPPHV